MFIISDTKYLRVSPKKVKSTARNISGLNTTVALEKLFFANTKASRILTKTIKSAVANAVNNLKKNADNLIIRSISVNKGPVLKRWQPVSRGMAHKIKKPTSHIKIVLEEIQIVKRLLTSSTEKKVEQEKDEIKKSDNSKIKK
ncbi:50S ribosomal protein L22 [Candidatus Gottesmanbacteria bacterium]|nr:50S ribosomal protein L22 [Candidatus Gottesmanbacteria bacterium]